MSSRNLFAFAVATSLALPAAAWEPAVVGLEDDSARPTAAPAMVAVVDPLTFVTPEVIGTREDDSARPTAAPGTVAVVDPLTFVTPEVVGTRWVDVRATDARAARQEPPGRAANSPAAAEWLVRD